MPDVTITNVSSEQVFLRDFYLSLAPGASATFYRSAGDLARSSGLHEYIAAGTVTFSLAYTADETAADFTHFPTVPLTDTIRTPEGGFAVPRINKTGAASIKGTIVEESMTTDGAFAVADANSDEPIGIVYQDGIADGALCLIIVTGTAEVLLKDTTAATRHNWVKTSNVTGRADATTTTPPGASPDHWQEIGHAAQDAGAGTDVLCLCTLHFN